MLKTNAATVAQIRLKRIQHTTRGLSGTAKKRIGMKLMSNTCKNDSQRIHGHKPQLGKLTECDVEQAF